MRRLKQQLDAEAHRSKVDIELTYVTRRGPWYHQSWKGNPERSGTLAMNIGIHFFDMLMWLFGRVEHNEVHLREGQRRPARPGGGRAVALGAPHPRHRRRGRARTGTRR